MCSWQEARVTVAAGGVGRAVLEVTWEGAADAYTIMPLEGRQTDAYRLRADTIESVNEGNRQVQRQTILVTPAEEGEFTLEDLTLSCAVNLDVQESVVIDKGDKYDSLSLQIPPLTLKVRPATGRTAHFSPFVKGILALFVVAVLICTLLILLYIGKRKKSEVDFHTEAPCAIARAALHEARRYRLDGDFYGFYQQLATAIQSIELPEAPALLEKLKARTEEVGYKGVRPSDHDIEGDLHDVERLVARCSRTGDTQD